MAKPETVGSSQTLAEWQIIHSYSGDNPEDAITSLILDELANNTLRSPEEWAKDFQHVEIDATQISNVLERICEGIADYEDPLAVIEEFAKIIPQGQFNEAIKQKYPKFVDAITTAKQMFESAQNYLERKEKEFTPTVGSWISKVIDGIVSVIEAILSAFGLESFFRPSESDIQADFKGQKIMMLISLFSMMTAILLPVLGPELGGMIIGGVLLGIIALSLIYPLVRPAPSQINLGQNWTKLYNEGNLPVVDGRKHIVDELAETLIANRDVKTHPMLIGKTGVGKTETVKALVEGIERGDYPELKGKRVFYFNMADLVSNRDMFGSGNKIISQIREKIGRHADDIILIFDEIHLACQKKGKTAIADQLKTMLDPGNKGFSHVIGITTEEEYYRDIFVDHSAFARRFKTIKVGNTTDEETLGILNNSLLKQAPKLILEKKLVSTLLDKTKEQFGEDAAQPATALRILSQCVHRTSQTQKSETEKAVETLRHKICLYLSQGSAGQGEDLLPYNHDEIDLGQLETQLRDLEAKLETEKRELEAFFKKRDRLDDVKVDTLRKVMKVANFQRESLSAQEKQQVKAFALMSHYLAPAMEKRVRAEAERLGVKTTIDSTLIDEVIADQLESDRRVKEAIAAGKQSMSRRAELTTAEQ